MTDSIQRVAVLGAGTIGASWAALFLARGLTVQVHDPSPTQERDVRAYVATAWPSLERLGLAAQGDPDRVTFHDNTRAAVEGVQFVQESVPERLDIKHATYRAIEPALAPEAIVATSASGLMVREMQAGFADPARFLLAHPFNPPHLIPLVELLGNEKTDPAAVDQAADFYEACGKTTIRLHKEVPGHVANRLQAALWREAIHLVIEGVASLEDVDKAVSAGPGLRWAVMGPHMLFNLAAGPDGMNAFCDRYGPSFQRWWDDLGAPRLEDGVAQRLVDGLSEAEQGRSLPQIAAARDERLVRILQTLAQAD
ncbi:MAG: 3-hydroxyacyl-CoA dehydrogenase NAD-binding domain-containing protein [Pseudomonadota bacterium]